MSPLVNGEIACCDESLFALVAGVRSFSGVNAFVLHQATLICEGRLASRTGERFLAAVKAAMSPETRLMVETCRALETRKWPLVPMNACVVFKVATRNEAFRAYFATERLDPIMTKKVITEAYFRRQNFSTYRTGAHELADRGTHHSIIQHS